MTAKKQTFTVGLPRSSGNGRVIGTPRGDVFIVRSGTKAVRNAAADQTVEKLLPKMGQAISRPGVNRGKVFMSHSGKVVYAYSMDPSDPERLIREDEKGNKIPGRMVKGAFRPTLSPA